MKKLILNENWVNARYEAYLKPTATNKARKMFLRLERLNGKPLRWWSKHSFDTGEPPLPKYILA